jgi:chorismate-pyruvate lyase
MNECGEHMNTTKYTDVIPADTGFDVLQRILVAHDGTVQKLLALICKTDVHVLVGEQKEKGNVISRRVYLYVMKDGKQRTLCIADSAIPIDKNENGFVNGIRSTKWGIGQLIESISLHSKREILDVWVDSTTFGRNYRLVGIDCKLDVIITEEFMYDNIKECME